MPRDKQTMNVVLRAYSLVASFLVLAFLPVFLDRIGTERRPPVALDGPLRLDGSVGGKVAADGRRGRFSGISIDGAPFVPAGGAVAVRDLPYLPAGTPVSYREVREGTASTISGTVEERRRPPGALATALIFGLLALVFGVVGAGMAVGGANRQALYAAAMLSGSGLLLGGILLEPNASLVSDPARRAAVVLLWNAFPRHFAFLWLVSFTSLFPVDVRESRLSRVSRAAIAGVTVLQAVVATVPHLLGLLDGLPVPAQAAVLRGSRQATLLVFVLGFGAVLSLAALQLREYRRRPIAAETRQRADVVGAALLAGLAPPLLLAVPQTVFLIVTGRFLFPSLVMALSYLPTLLIPPALAYAVLAPRVESVGILVRKAALFGFAARTVRVLSLVPLAWLGAVLWANRQERLGDLIAARPFALSTAVFASVLGLASADRARAAVERLFFRRREDAAGTLRELAEKAGKARSVSELAGLLTSETDRALALESIALFVRDPGSDTYSCEGRALPSLEGASAIVEEALGARGPFKVAPDDPASPLYGLPEMERHWLDATRARLLVPLVGSDGRLLALLALGDKRSELPFDRQDEQLLAAAAASASLALENQVLRSSGASSGDDRARGPAAAGEAPGPGEGAGLLCRRCSRVFAPGSGALCPDDDTPLEPAPVPHLLAGKYRFEKRIGVGGMGVVYRARDVALSRDVAVKVLPRVSHQAVRRLRREARAAARLIHPNLGLIFAAETWRGTPMLVLEFLDGGTLEDRISCGPIPASDVVEWGIRLSGALEAAHAQGILHRDVKPSNVGFTTQGVPKLLDFGLARLLDDPAAAAADEAPSGLPSLLGPLSASGGSVSLTRSGRLVGTVAYMSPEAVQGHLPSPGFDVWGLTLSLYEALTGANPFAVAPAERAMNLILTVPAPDPRVVRPDCPGPLASFFDRALSKSALDRPATARELRDRLSGLRT